MKNKLFTLVFSLLLAALSLSYFFIPKKDFSENENRMLASFPAFSVESLKNGSFASDFATYLSDHFIGRDLWVSVKALAEQSLLKTENNGVFKGKDGYLIDSFDEKSTSHFNENLQAVAEFEQTAAARYGIQTRTILAPTAATILSDKLPPFAVTADGNAMLREAKSVLTGFIDVSDALAAHRDEYIYYRTDHHWTAQGAYYAYAAYRAADGKTVLPYADWEIETVADNFYGTTYSRYGLFVGQQADSIAAPSANATGVVSLKTAKTETNSIYFSEKLQEKDKYLYFLGGNDPLVTVKTTSANGKTLLLIKDSYANSFLPYLIGDYETILLADMRYYQGVVFDLIAAEKVTDILILYNLKSFAEDTYLPFINFTE